MGRRKRRIFKSGQKVTIYYDPFNNKDPEGEATLISLVKKRKETDIWYICFEDGFRTKRAIKHEVDEKLPTINLEDDYWNHIKEK